MNIVFLGPPGAGKGTQAVRIAKTLSVPHISTGDIFREAIAGGTEMGLKAKAIMDKGELVPDDVVIGIVRERLDEKDASDGFLLDGFPRTEAQAKALDIIVESKGGIDKVIELVVDDEELIRRLAGRRVCKNCGKNYHAVYNPPKNDSVCDDCGGEVYQREDDKEETVRRRLEVYKKQTQPLINYYKNKSILFEVNGEKPIDQVMSEIISIIKGDS